MPDNNSLKDTLLKFVSTIIQQQEQIVLLQNSMTQMSINNSTTQQNIVTWTTNCINDLQNRNHTLQKNLNISEAHIQNFVYNIQGFSDVNKNGNLIMHSKIVSKDYQLSIASADPPLILATKIQTTTMDPNKDLETIKALEITENIGHSNNLFDSINSGKNDVNLSNSGEKYEEAKNMIENDTNINANDMIRDTKKPSHDSKKYYLSIKQNNMPYKDIMKKWQWAIRKVMSMNKTKKLKLSLIDIRVMRGLSIVERLERLEDDTYTIPLEVNKKVASSQLKITNMIHYECEKLRHELDQISIDLQSQNLKNETIIESISLKIDNMKNNFSKLDRACADFDRNIEKLKTARIDSEKSDVGNNSQIDEKERYVYNYIFIWMYKDMYVLYVQICYIYNYIFIWMYIDM